MTMTLPVVDMDTRAASRIPFGNLSEKPCHSADCNTGGNLLFICLSTATTDYGRCIHPELSTSCFPAAGCRMRNSNACGPVAALNVAVRHAAEPSQAMRLNTNWSIARER